MKKWRDLRSSSNPFFFSQAAGPLLIRQMTISEIEEISKIEKYFSSYCARQMRRGHAKMRCAGAVHNTRTAHHNQSS